jgi:hypothetical protein
MKLIAPTKLLLRKLQALFRISKLSNSQSVESMYAFLTPAGKLVGGTAERDICVELTITGNDDVHITDPASEAQPIPLSTTIQALQHANYGKTTLTLGASVDEEATVVLTTGTGRTVIQQFPALLKNPSFVDLQEALNNALYAPTPNVDAIVTTVQSISRPLQIAHLPIEDLSNLTGSPNRFETIALECGCGLALVAISPHRIVRQRIKTFSDMPIVRTKFMSPNVAPAFSYLELYYGKLVSIAFKNSWATFQSNSTTMMVALKNESETSFPDWRQVIPDEPLVTVIVNKDTLRDAYRAATAAASKYTRYVPVTFTKMPSTAYENGVVVLNFTDDKASAIANVVPIVRHNMTNPEQQYKFRANAVYMLQVIDSLPPGLISIQCNIDSQQQSCLSSPSAIRNLLIRSGDMISKNILPEASDIYWVVCTCAEERTK